VQVPAMDVVLEVEPGMGDDESRGRANQSRNRAGSWLRLDPGRNWSSCQEIGTVWGRPPTTNVTIFTMLLLDGLFHLEHWHYGSWDKWVPPVSSVEVGSDIEQHQSPSQRMLGPVGLENSGL
jgi:hypothetical protein